MTKPVTPAGLPRNREADAWRLRAEDEARWSNRGWAAAFVLGMAALGSSITYRIALGERDAARAQVSAAEQRAEMAEARNAENTCGHQYDVGRMRKQVCVGVATGFQWWSLSESAPPRVIYDDVGTAPVSRGIIPAGPVTLPGTIPPCPAPVGTLCLYDGDRSQP